MTSRRSRKITCIVSAEPAEPELKDMPFHSSCPKSRGKSGTSNGLSGKICAYRLFQNFLPAGSNPAMRERVFFAGDRRAMLAGDPEWDGGGSIHIFPRSTPQGDIRTVVKKMLGHEPCCKFFQDSYGRAFHTQPEKRKFSCHVFCNR